MSDFLKLDSSDFIKGLIVAIGSAVVAWLGTVINLPGFDYTLFDWKKLVAIAITAGVTYLGKNLFSTSDGAFLGAIGGKRN